MTADSWLNKHRNTIRDVCYTSMSTASNIQVKYLHPQSTPCCSPILCFPPHAQLSQTCTHTGQEQPCAWDHGQGPRQVHLQPKGMAQQKERCGEFLEYSGKRLMASR